MVELSLLRLAIGLILSLVISLLAYYRRSLTPSGVAGAVLVGTATFGLGGWTWGLLLIVFFVTSSILSHYKAARKEFLKHTFEKGKQRDFSQVLANGGVAAILAVASVWADSGGWIYALLLSGYIGSLATVNADTWATELGVLARGQPRLITSSARVPTGTSGGVTWQGSLAALAGALTIGVCAWFFLTLDRILGDENSLSLWWLAPIAAVSGSLGSLLDSFLGATIQRVYYCEYCHKETERRQHYCGHTPRPLRGLPWLHNDGVNVLAATAGAALAAVLGIALL